MSEDVVNHPSHYENNSVRIEPIDICELLDFNRGNAFKYCTRFQSKHPENIEEDLEKSVWYINRWFKGEQKDVLQESVPGFRLSLLLYYCNRVKDSNPILGRLGSGEFRFIDLNDFFMKMRTVVTDYLEKMNL